MTVNDLLEARPVVGSEELEAVAVVSGQPVRFAVVAVNEGEHGELELVLEARSVPRIASA